MTEEARDSNSAGQLLTAKAEIYQQLHADYLRRYDSTRKFEWIINGALWAGIVLASRELAGHVDLSSVPFWLIPVFGFLGAMAHFILWMYPIQCSENADGKLIHMYRYFTHLALRGKDPEKEEIPEDPLKWDIPQREDESRYKKWLKNSKFLKGMDWVIVECGVTFLLICLVIWFLKCVPWISNTTV